MRRKGKELENDARENPCFGCGPGNRSGLRMRFFDDGAVVRSEVAPRPEFEGWPTNWNLGLAVTAAIETGGWALWERLGPATLAGPLSVEGLGRLRLSEALRVEARLITRARRHKMVSTVYQRGKPVLRVSMPVVPLSAAQSKLVLQAYPGMPKSMRPAYEALAGPAR